MENFDVDLALRLTLDSKKAEKSDSMVLYASNLGVVPDSSMEYFDYLVSSLY